MAIGIDPKVDFAFKLVFGSPEHSRVTIHFLNAVMQLPHPITAVEILNPLQGKDRSEDKLIVLDVLARDDEGRRYNIEMQTTLPANLSQRLTYYNCINLVRQLEQGDAYYKLAPAISICVLDAVLFREAAEFHLSFRLRCDQRELVFSDDLVFHLLELPKHTPSSDDIRNLPPLEKWVYFLRNAEHLDVSELTSQLVDVEFEEAAGVLEMISRTPEERLYYEARQKALHDQEARLMAAHQQGLAIGREEGAELGELAGRVRMLQELLGEDVASTAELLKLGKEGLAKQVAQLQKRLRTRNP